MDDFKVGWGAKTKPTTPYWLSDKTQNLFVNFIKVMLF